MVPSIAMHGDRKTLFQKSQSHNSKRCKSIFLIQEDVVYLCFSIICVSVGL